jgi:hypothetical protein
MQRLMLKMLEGARFPTLLKVTGGLFVADLIVPDFIPLVDEILLGLATLVLSRWKDERSTKGLEGSS